MNRLARLTVIAAALCATGAAHADSFMTSIGYGSKKAAKIGPAPYSGSPMAPDRAQKMVRKATRLALGGDVAIAMDVARMVDSAAMDYPVVDVSFEQGLAAAAARGDAKAKFMSGYQKMFRFPNDDAAAHRIRTVAREQPNDSAIQLGAFQAIAQRAFFGGESKAGQERLFHEAAGYLKRAEALEATVSSRPMVREGLKQAKDYAALYPELVDALK